MVFNWDATQFCINPEGHATIVKCAGQTDKPPTALSAGGLGFAVKYYHFHNANGDMAPAVFIIADDSMGPMRAFVVCDGEPSQITVFQLAHILAEMARYRFEIRLRISLHLCCSENHGFT
jgi:hypothetical protein